MGSTTTSTEIHGGNNREREKWDLCSGGDVGRREGEPEQRGNGSFKFAGHIFLHSHHHKFAEFAIGDIEILLIKIIVKGLEQNFVKYNQVI